MMAGAQIRLDPDVAQLLRDLLEAHEGPTPSLTQLANRVMREQLQPAPPVRDSSAQRTEQSGAITASVGRARHRLPNRMGRLQ